MSDLEIVEITVCLDGFRHVCAAAARMCAAWNYLTRILEKKSDMLEQKMSTTCMKSKGEARASRYRPAWEYMNLYLGWTSGQNHIGIYNCTRGADKSGGGRGVESISLLERRIDCNQRFANSIARANIPPTHPQLGCKTHQTVT